MADNLQDAVAAEMDKQDRAAAREKVNDEFAEALRARIRDVRAAEESPRRKESQR